MPDKKRVYLFREGNATMRDLLGGKGANLAEMTNIGLPVPSGFTITTETCNEYTQLGRLPDGLWKEVLAALADVEKDMGKKLGDPNNPLLVSVRSGSKFSMPGMMDTVLNLGLNDKTLKGIIAATGNERFAYDAYRRFLMMFSDIVLSNDHHELSKHHFEQIFDELKEANGARFDTEVDTDGWVGDELGPNQGPESKMLAESGEGKVNAEGKEYPQDSGDESLVVSGVKCL